MLIESFHSGPRGRRRYCSLHRPMTRLVRSTGVVLCYPLGHEYYRAHRAYVKLADQLAHLGFPVLRFDYIGSGDSDGSVGHARLDDWLDDVLGAVDELRRSESVSSIALGGLRFGATLSMLAAQRSHAVQTLMLWDPVLNGTRYIDALHRLHARMLKDLERFPRARRTTECGDDEFIGTRYVPRFLHELSAIRPETLHLADTPNVLLVRSAKSTHAETVTRALAPRARVGAMDSERDYGWSDVRRIGEAIMDPDVVRHLGTSMNAVAA